MKLKKNQITKSQLSRLIKVIGNGRMEIIVENGKSDICCLLDIDKKLYDKNYIKIKTLLTNDDFLKEVQSIREKYKIPADGLKTREEIDEWYSKNSQWIQKTVINQDSKTTIEQDKFYDDIEVSILKKFNLSIDFLEPMRWLILFNNLDYKSPVCRIKLTENKKGSKQMWLQVFPQTRKKDIMRIWNQISSLQEHLSNYRGKLKDWINFERDYEIYRLYKGYRKELGTRKRAENVTNMLKGQFPIDYYISREIAKKYPNVSLSSIRQIISRFKKRTSDT